MTLQLTIKEALPVARKPTNKVVVHVRSMCGDGDAYNEESFKFDPADDKQRDHAYDVIRLLEAYADLGWNAQCDVNNSSKWGDLYEANFGVPESVSVLDRIHDLCGYDMIYDQLAAPDSWHLTYFDDKGIEHRVELTVDGKPFKGRRS